MRCEQAQRFGAEPVAAGEPETADDGGAILGSHGSGDPIALRGESVGGQKIVEMPQTFAREDPVPVQPAKLLSEETEEAVLAIVSGPEVHVPAFGGERPEPASDARDGGLP